MKKYYCFYCQQDVMPKKILWWHICPHCRHQMTDKGEGFYRVCEHCGANMPVEDCICVKCGYGKKPNQPLIRAQNINSPWLMWLIRATMLFLSIILAVGIVYISFYLLFALLVVGLAYFIFNMFFLLRRR